MTSLSTPIAVLVTGAAGAHSLQESAQRAQAFRNSRGWTSRIIRGAIGDVVAMARRPLPVNFLASVCDGIGGEVATPTLMLREDGQDRPTTDKAGCRGERRKSESRPQLVTGKIFEFGGGVVGTRTMRRERQLAGERLRCNASEQSLQGAPLTKASRSSARPVEPISDSYRFVRLPAGIERRRADRIAA